MNGDRPGGDMWQRLGIVLASASALATAGCPSGPGGLTGGDPNAPRASAGAAGPAMPGPADPNGPAGYVLIVRIKLVTIEVPVGMASGSEEIWSYLDEEPVRAANPAALGRNGFRVGRGRRDNWPDLARVLKRLTGHNPAQSLAVAVPGNPLPIVLKERQGEQTIFVFHEDRTLSGADYPPGDNVLAVACTLDEDDRSRVFVSAVPQIVTTLRRQRFLMGEGGPVVAARPDVYPFEPLTFQVNVPRGDFVVVGPGSQSRRASSVGHHFLVRDKKGVEFETLIVLMPEVVAAALPTRPALGGT